MSEELVTYKANCHCGTVKFTVKLPDILAETVTRCTCSICTKNGYLLVYPKSEDVHYVSGQDDLGAYRFGGASKRHLFCKNCGNSLFIDFSTSEHPSERVFTAVNMRSFVDAADLIPKLTYREWDGRNKMKPAYVVPEFN